MALVCPHNLVARERERKRNERERKRDERERERERESIQSIVFLYNIHVYTYKL